LHDDDSDHQDQVKELMKNTADSLDDIALKILFISVQQNNLELCLTYAVKQYVFRVSHLIAAETYSSLVYLRADATMVCIFRIQDDDCAAKGGLKEELVSGCLQWFRHAYVG
jgi:hypothetical protein